MCFYSIDAICHNKNIHKVYIIKNKYNKITMEKKKKTGMHLTSQTKVIEVYLEYLYLGT